MALVYWRDDCKTQHPVIDNEHQKILQILKTLYQDVVLNESSVVLRATLDQLFNFVLEHSETEEALMHQVLYPDLSEHIDQHEIVLSTIFNLRLKVERDEDCVTTDVVHELVNWFNRHTWDYDLRMVQYAQAQSLMPLADLPE